MVFYAFYRIKAVSAGGTQKGKKYWYEVPKEIIFSKKLSSRIILELGKIF